MQEANHQRAVQGLESELQAARRQLQRLQVSRPLPQRATRFCAKPLRHLDSQLRTWFGRSDALGLFGDCLRDLSML